MKLIYSLILIAVFGSASGQVYSIRPEAEILIQERTIILNGAARATLGGKTRAVIPIDLPKGTKSWYYSFSTSPDETGTRNLNLLLQVSGILASPSGITSAVLSHIKVPAGSASIDVYLLNQENADLFMNKVDNNGGNFYYIREGSVTNTSQAVVPIHNSNSGRFYIGLKKPSVMDGINIRIEAVAEVNKKVYEDKWTSENIDRIYNACLKTFITKSAGTEQVCNCTKDKITTGYTPTEYNNLSNTDRNKLYEDAIAGCSSETGNVGILDKDARIKEINELLRGQAVIKDYEGQEQSLSELIKLGVNNWEIYNSLGFCQLCQKKYDEAKKSLTIGLGKNPTDLFLLGNLGDYYLLTGKYGQAIEIFSAHKNERLVDKRRFKEAVADDLKEFERLGLANTDFNKVREELRID